MNGKITSNNPTPSQKQQMESKQLANAIKPIDASDHIIGSPEARIIVVEYSDTECPYCKPFHVTMNTIMQEYGSSGDVAWVYRHYPIEQLHANSIKEAEATECAAKLGGNSKFWEYINKVYEMTESNDGLDLNKLPVIATEIGLSSSEFNACLESGEFASKIATDIQNAQAAGIFGTPYSVIIDTKTEEHYPLEGAYPYTQVKQFIDIILES